MLFSPLLIPDYMVPGIVRHVVFGDPTGDFLTAVFENNLLLACAKADGTNMQIIPSYAALLYGVLPTGSHGSPVKVKKWREARAAHPLDPKSVEWPITWEPVVEQIVQDRQREASRDRVGEGVGVDPQVPQDGTGGLS